MDDMFDNSNSEVFTGKLAVAIAGRVDAKEDELEEAKTIEIDQGSDTMKTSLKSIISITETLRRRTEKRKKHRERKKLKNSKELSH